MKIGCCTGSFNRFGAERYKKMAELGFLYADFGIRPIGCTETEEDYLAYFKNERNLADSAGVEIHQIHAPFVYPPKDSTREERELHLEQLKKTMPITKMLGAKNWVAHPLLPFYGKDEESNYEENWKINVDFFSSLLPVAKEYDITICLENVPSSKYKRFLLPEETLRFIKEINDDHFKMCLDTGHCAYYGCSPADSVRLAGKDLAVMHVHDTKSVGRDEHLFPSFGMINWKDFASSLTEINYDGVISLETGPSGCLSLEMSEHMLKTLNLLIKDLFN